MEYFELIISVFLKQDIKMINVQEKIGQFLNKSMLLDDLLARKHAEKGNKLYVFSGLYPIEHKTKVYRNGAIYIFRVRSLERAFLQVLESCIRKTKDSTFQFISIERKMYSKRIIQDLYAVTPVIVTIDNRPWIRNVHDINDLIERLQANADKKYKDAFHENLDNIEFIQRIELLNEKPIATAYKDVKLLGNKLKLTVNTDEDSQKLACTVLGAGLGEKGSSLGAGFCFANFI